MSDRHIRPLGEFAKFTLRVTLAGTLAGTLASACASQRAATPHDEADDTEVVDEGDSPVRDDREVRLDDAFEAMLVGHWTGTAEDGTGTPEDVDLTMTDTEYAISAGVVTSSAHWRIIDDHVWLAPTPGENDAQGLCFRPKRATRDQLVGEWAYAEDDECHTTWYPVILSRQGG